MKFSYFWLQSFFQKDKLPKPEKLAEILSIHSFEVKGIEKVGLDFVLDVDVLPNRPDCFSHLGIAREIGAITNYELRIMNYEPNEDKDLKVKNFLEIKVENQEYCPRYTARVITDVKVGESPKWIKERLKSCGLRPINNIVDITNYVMLETGQPLHAFDFEKLAGKKIFVRLAKKGEKILTLDDLEYTLNEKVLVIADEKKPIAIAGIKGGKETGIDENTKIVVLESANFNPRLIRQGAQFLKLKTDASLRFEHGLDPNLTEFAINRAAFLIQDICQGKVAKGLIDFYPQKILPKKIEIETDYIKSLLGIKIPKREIRKILKRLGFKIVSETVKKIKVENPAFRLDISIPEDLIEEIGRIYGYQKIPSQFPIASLIAPKRNLEIFWEEMIKDILKEMGFIEVYNYSFISENEAEILGFKKEKLIEIENPTSLEFKYLRPSLIPKLLKNALKNQKNFQEIKIFEIGKIFKIENSKPLEKKMLSGLVTGESFFYLKGVLDALFQKLGISEFFYDEYQATPEESKISIWHPKKIAEIKIEGEEIGFLGQISKRILKKIGLEKSLAIFDIDFSKLQNYCTEETFYQPLSKYPAAIRDISVLVPRDVKVEEVLNKIENVSPLIKDVDLFDIYEGEEIAEGKKNLAFHIIYQAKDRQISSKEIEEIQNKIIQILEKDPEWEVRK